MVIVNDVDIKIFKVKDTYLGVIIQFIIVQNTSHIFFDVFVGSTIFLKAFIMLFKPLIMDIIFFYVLYHGISYHGNGVGQRPTK